MKPTIEKTQDGFAVLLPSGNYLAEQGGAQWEQDTPQGWAIYSSREAAEQTLRTYKPADDPADHFRVGCVLGHETWTGLSLMELFKAGRLGDDPRELVLEVIRAKFPAKNIEDIKRNHRIALKAVERMKA